jgi:hypothetical protein
VLGAVDCDSLFRHICPSSPGANIVITPLAHQSYTVASAYGTDNGPVFLIAVSLGRPAYAFRSIIGQT